MNVGCWRDSRGGGSVYNHQKTVNVETGCAELELGCGGRRALRQQSGRDAVLGQPNRAPWWSHHTTRCVVSPRSSSSSCGGGGTRHVNALAENYRDRRKKITEIRKRRHTRRCNRLAKRKIYSSHTETIIIRTEGVRQRRR